jgi:hypothetical protein
VSSSHFLAYFNDVIKQFSPALKLGDEVNGVLDSGDRGGFLFWDFSVEFLLNSHDELNSVEGVGTEVIDERGSSNNLVGINTELLDNDTLDLGLKFSRHKEGSGGSGGAEEGRGRREGAGAGNKSEGEEGLEHGGV